MSVFGVLGEDESDTKMLQSLIRRILNQNNAKVLTRASQGCSKLRRKAFAFVKDMLSEGATHFVICHDSDGEEPQKIRELLVKSLRPKELGLASDTYRIIVPVQEIEAWLIADESAIQKVFSGVAIKSVQSPETIRNPKEWLEARVVKKNMKPLYIPKAHNQAIALHLNLQTVTTKCNSFREFHEFVSDSAWSA